MPLFGATRSSAPTPSVACPAWARTYLLTGRRPRRDTEAWREFSHAVLELDKGRSEFFLGIKRLWLEHREELLASWKHPGVPFGECFETYDTTPDLMESLGPDPRECLK